MKICPKCNAPQKDDSTICEECGADLTYPLQKTDDPFNLGIFGKIMITIDILGMIAAVALMILFMDNHAVNLSWCFVSAVLLIVAAIATGIPDLNWHFYELSMEFKHGVSNPEPSNYYLFMWKLGIVAIPIICFIGLAMYIPHLL